MSTRYSSSIVLLLCALGLIACTGGTVSYSGGGNNALPAATISLSAAPTTVASGGLVLLTWSSTGATNCSAGGAWSGAKATLGSQTINSVQVTSVYSLTCTGGTGSTTVSTTVTVTGGGSGVNGTVDSSLVDRHQEPANLVYAFAGSNTTTGTPVSSAPVTQDTGACTFRYSLVLPDGSYTIALTSDGGATFKRSANVTVAGAVAVLNFAPARVLQVGPTRQYTDPSQVIGVVRNGDVVEIDAGVYNNTEAVWPSTVNTLVLRGVNGRAHLVAPATISNQKAIWVTQGTNTMVENIEFSDAVVPDNNGSGIRVEGPDLAVCGSYFHDNQGGMLGNDGVGNVLVEYSEFAFEGNCIDASGCMHHVYFSHNDRVIIRYSYFHHAVDGHLVKSRAKSNYILYNRIMDEDTGSSSYQINLTNGGLSYVIGNLVQKGTNTANTGAMLTYGEDHSLLNPSLQLYVVNNTFVNDLGSRLVTYILVGAGAAVVENNLFVGSNSIVSGPATQTTNLQTSTPNFVDRATFDYRPMASTPGIGQGTAPGLGGTFDLTPFYQYVHPTNREVRPTVNAIDIGAYEYTP